MTTVFNHVYIVYDPEYALMHLDGGKPMTNFVSTEKLSKFKELYDQSLPNTYYNKTQVESLCTAAANAGAAAAIEYSDEAFLPVSSAYETLSTSETEALFNPSSSS